jgi:hypothetical protein
MAARNSFTSESVSGWSKANRQRKSKGTLSTHWRMRTCGKTLWTRSRAR